MKMPISTRNRRFAAAAFSGLVFFLFATAVKASSKAIEQGYIPTEDGTRLFYVKAGSGALTHGQPDSAGVPAALANLTITVPFNDLRAVQKTFAANRNEIAAIILEPVPANAGLYLPEPGFLQELRALCDVEGSVKS